jgi:uncharacterized membrane protein YccC
VSWRPHDPDHVALRRGVRAAIALPITMAVALFVLHDVAGALFAVLGTIGLLVSADFAGRPLQRLAAYLMTGAVGAVALTIGWAVAGTMWLAVLVTLVVAFALGFAAFLRGGVAVGTSAVMLVYVVAVTTNGAPGELAQYQTGWWCAVVICTVTALVLLPRDGQAGVRRALAEVFDAGAQTVRAWWLANDPAMATAAAAEFDRRVDVMVSQYGGQRIRLPGLTAHDQALDLLVAHLGNTRHLLPGATSGDLGSPSAERDGLATEVAVTLDDLARAMREPSFLPSAQRLDAARGRFREHLDDLVVDMTSQGVSARDTAADVSAQNPIRMTAVLVEQMTQATRIANQGEAEDLDRQPPLPTRTWRRVLRSQLNLRSPWTRNAVRSALALGIAVLVVDLTGVEHGFWVLLGTISVLRFDAAGTRRLAVPAIVATAVGAAAGVLILLLLSGRPAELWVLLPFAVFLAAWSGAALGFAAGQAAFTMLVLVAVGIIDWPVPHDLAIVRVEDVAIGIVVALVVALLMWPRGAAGALRQQLADATDLAGVYLGGAIASYTSRDTDLDAARVAATLAADRAVETIELARAQRGPALDLDPWMQQATATYILITAGRVTASLEPKYEALPTSPVVTAALSETRRASDAYWSEVAASIRADRPSAAVPIPGVGELDLAGAGLGSVNEAAAFVLAVWAIDWAAFVSRMPTLTADTSPTPSRGTSR